MTPAEKRVKELLDRWLTSLDLHLEYVDLKDSAYNNVQPWPVHDRPTRWVLELAKQKALEMQAAFDSRLSMGDAKFAESVELIVFLSTLVGIQHVQRYIPLANPEHHGQGTLTELDGLKPVGNKAKSKEATPPTAATTIQATAIMPPRVAAPANPSPVPTTVAPVENKKIDNDATREMPRPSAKSNTPSPAKKAAPAASPSKPATETKSPTAIVEALSDIHNLVISDAVRLLNWGRPWHELAELIARIADRPKLPEVRRLLRSHRAAIEMRVADAEDEKEEKQNKA
jgi:hypothetical protein